MSNCLSGAISLLEASEAELLLEQEVRGSATKYFPSTGDFQLLTLLKRVLQISFFALFESDWLKSNKDVAAQSHVGGVSAKFISNIPT